MNTQSQEIRDGLRAELESARRNFHILLDSLSEADLQTKSRNPGWTNGEILAHMTFGFIILNALLPMVRFWGRLPGWSSKPFASLLNAFTGPFNWINALGARLQGRVFTYRRIGRVYDRAYFSLVKQLEHIRDGEWGHGMYYPTRWDSDFSVFMTISDLFQYPVRHFNFHRAQITK